MLNAQLQRQMISSQGKTSAVDNLVVTQTIGQQSIIGSYNVKNFYYNQGFQQPFWNRLIQSNQPEFSANFFPNPFVSEITFRFTNLNDESFKITIFDTAGRLVYQSEQSLNDNDLLLDLENLSKEIEDLFAVEMEGASVAQVAKQEKIPFQIIRVISDEANENSSEDFSKFLIKYNNHSAKLISVLMENIENLPI